MRKLVLNPRKTESVKVAAPESALQAIENLIVFDARCLDRETRHELLRVLPDLTRIRKAWKAHFSEFGCVSCHRKRTEYGAGGFCSVCLARITARMRDCYRKISGGRNTSEEIAALTRRFDTAQMLFGADDVSKLRKSTR